MSCDDPQIEGTVVFVDLERLISRLVIDGYLKQEFTEVQSPSISAYLRPGTNAVQLTASNSQRAGDQAHKIHIELTIRVEQVTHQSKERPAAAPSKRKLINEHCLAELKEECKQIFGASDYSHVLSDGTLHDLVKLMP